MESPNESYEIAGVVGDVHQRSLDKKPNPGVFICAFQEPTGPAYLVARTHGDPKQLANAIQAEIHSMDKDLPIAEVKTMDEYVSASVAAPRFNTILLGAFAALALVLAAVGIFGVISYSVAQRTQEIGIRRALGADSGSVVRMVLAQGLGLTVIGLAIGAAGALAVTRLDPEPAVRRGTDGSCDLHERGRRAQPGRLRRQLSSRAPRVEGRSDGGLTL